MSLRLVHYYPRAWVGNGGCTFAVRGWASALAQQGAEVTVVSDGSGEVPTTSDVRWLATPHQGFRYLRAPVGLEPILTGHDLLILHSGWAYHNVRAARDAIRSRVPYVLTPHGAYEPNVFRRKSTAKRVWWTMFERELLARAQGIHVFFEEQSNELRQIGYRGPVIVSPNGLTVPDFEAPATRADYLLWMGRFDIETKGLDLLLRALASLHANERPPARLHGPDWRGGKQRVAQLVRELGLDDDVQIGAPLYGPEKWRALRECGAFVFPARWDAQSVMVLEAAAAGAPLVMTDTTVIGRHLGSYEAAIVVEATPAAIASGIRRGLSPEAAKVGTQASRVVHDRFSWPAVAADYTRQITALLAESKAK